MQEINKRTGEGYEIQLYYPKERGQYREKTGNESTVIQCDNIGEVAQWFARRSWGSVYGDSDTANPTVWFNGKPWCKYEYSEVIIECNTSK